ncbi:hypothetical protein J0A68_08970 [Algoriphagus sp. H41]|uniref:Uncharacterized protein n=1 Tax=Algoriphagus oliviformis TaxID=2811231 RepID=A0ABS3C1X7_9BACT|nr:hypothetical protein [Algoriphagus oliviformis]MBN7811086.1 hypothetical protein [Algoriphagus oliviformis]
MEEISIQVSPELAKAWEGTPDELKQKITKLLEEQLSKLIDISSTKEEFKVYLSDLQKEMLNKGLTQETLDDILR